MRKLLVPVVLMIATSGCGILYKQPIYQGTLVDPAAVEQLQVGMSKQQVQALLGSPSIDDPFHAQRWDYTATRRTDRRGNTEVKNLVLQFENDALVKWEGDQFAKEDEALADRMGRFGNLAKEKKRRR